MKTDSQFYLIFKACPELFDVFAPLDKATTYRFDAMVFKDVLRSCDGVFEPEDTKAVTYIVEFQAQKEANVYPRILLEMAAYKLEKGEREVRSILIFLSEDLDPKPKIWWDFSQTCSGGFRVVYLDETLRALPRHHPLVATMAPLLEKKEQVLKQEALQCLKNIHNAGLKPAQVLTLEKVFFSFLTQRFSKWTREELRTMLGFDTPVEETVFYKEVFQEGKTEGKLEGMLEEVLGAKQRLDHQIAFCQDGYTKGLLVKESLDFMVSTMEAERTRLEARIQEIKKSLAPDPAKMKQAL